MAKWYYLIVQEKGQMPQQFGMFGDAKRAATFGKALVAAGLSEESINLASWEDTERVANLERNLADLTDEELKQL